jgi:hypothetical protein
MVRRCYHQMTVGKSLGCDRVVAYRRAMAIMFSSITCTYSDYVCRFDVAPKQFLIGSISNISSIETGALRACAITRELIRGAQKRLDKDNTHIALCCLVHEDAFKYITRVMNLF